MTQQSKLDLIKNLPTQAEMAQIIPTLRTLNAKIKELEKKVSALELEKKQLPQKTKRFNFFKSR